MTPSRDAVTSWLVAFLEGHPNSYQVGDHQAPDPPVEYPYWVVWSIPGGALGGPPLGAAASDAAFVFQVDSVGRSRTQAERQGDMARDRIVGRTVSGSFQADKASPSGIVILDRFLDGNPGGAVPEGDQPNEVWTFSERYVIEVSSQT